MARNYKRCCCSCWSNRTKKDWKRRWRQSYKCSICGYVWIQSRRKKSVLDNEHMYKEYSIHKQTYNELANKYSVSRKTIQKTLDSFAPTHCRSPW